MGVWNPRQEGLGPVATVILYTKGRGPYITFAEKGEGWVGPKAVISKGKFSINRGFIIPKTISNPGTKVPNLINTERGCLSVAIFCYENASGYRAAAPRCRI